MTHFSSDLYFSPCFFHPCSQEQHLLKIQFSPLLPLCSAVVRPRMEFCDCFLALQCKRDTDTAERVHRNVLHWTFPNIVLKAACRDMMCYTSAWPPVNWRHTVWICIYVLVFFLQERNWAAAWGEQTSCSCAKINTPRTVLWVKAVLGALAGVVLLKLHVECWVWLCFYHIKAGLGRTEQIIMASLSYQLCKYLCYQLLSNAANATICLIFSSQES